MAEVKTEVKALLDQGWEVCTADEVRLEHEAETRRMQPPKGQRTKLSVDRQKTSQSFSDALPPTSRTVTPYPTEQNQNTEQTTLAPDLLQQETGTGKTAVVPDNARPHHARALTDLHEPGRLLERITPVFLPPYAPDHNPVEHVRNTAKNNTANIQHETPEETLGASASHITGRTFDHDFEHLPTPRNQKRFCFMTAIAIENNIEETVDLELKRPSTLIGSNSPTIIGNQSGTMRPPRISLQWRTPAAVGLFSECLKMASIIPPRDLRQSPGMQIPSNAYFESRMRGSARPSSD